MVIWSHGGEQYSLRRPPGSFELAGVTGSPRLTISVSDQVVVHAGGGTVPWPILRKLVGLVDAVAALPDLPVALPLTRNVWWHGEQKFEVNTFHLGDFDSWCYELYEVKPDKVGNDYFEVRIPDASPEDGPFIPMPSDLVIMTMHGEWVIPWPVFRRFLAAIEAAGDIVEPVI